MTPRSSACGLHLVRVAVPERIKVAFVAPSLRILGGQAVQADRLLAAWQGDPDVDAWLVPVNPMPPALLRFALDVKYLRTVVNELIYVPLLVRELTRADVVHIFSASYASFLLAPLPAMLVARALGKPIVLNYRRGEAPDHLQRSAIARYYADNDIYLQSPDIDNMPTSVIEAFASGLPAVSTDAGGVPAIVVHDRYGLLAPAGDHEALAAHVLRLLDEPDRARAMARAAYATCGACTWPAVRRQWLDAYRTAAAVDIQSGAPALAPDLDSRSASRRHDAA